GASARGREGARAPAQPRFRLAAGRDRDGPPRPRPPPDLERGRDGQPRGRGDRRCAAPAAGGRVARARQPCRRRPIRETRNEVKNTWIPATKTVIATIASCSSRSVPNPCEAQLATTY